VTKLLKASLAQRDDVSDSGVRQNNSCCHHLGALLFNGFMQSILFPCRISKFSIDGNFSNNFAKNNSETPARNVLLRTDMRYVSVPYIDQIPSQSCRSMAETELPYIHTPSFNTAVTSVGNEALT
jgi:hypothetical protein